LDFRTVSRPLLCVTVTAPTTAELRLRRDAVADADLVELRLDSVADPDVAGALAGRRRRVIVTCRPTWEGGQFKGSEEERCKLLAEAHALGADYVDVEWRARFDDLLEKTQGRRIVLSMHDFQSTPADLRETARAMRATRAEVLKIATYANALSDCLPLMELGRDEGKHGSVVVVAMGEHGLPSRVLASRFGSAWTYAGDLAGIGQVTASMLVDEYRFRTVGESTDIYGVAGSPVSHSVSPSMHNAAFRASRLDAVYLPFRAASAEDFLRFARAIGLKGASVTIPFKVALFDRVDEVDAVARRIGAINTIRVLGGRWLGGNTDAAGFLRPLQDRNVSLSTMRTSILGAGGAARAVAIALAPSGSTVTIHARTPERAREVAMIVSGKVGPWPPRPGSWDLLVNCTPLGMHPRIDESPMPVDGFAGQLVYDLVYNPPATRLVRDAVKAGMTAIGGLDMLVAQAQEQFQWWTDLRAPAGVMRAAAEKRLAEFTANEDHLV
jgi:3-dehydroquinate dehydratase/shikimate dehydrogenase